MSAITIYIYNSIQKFKIINNENKLYEKDIYDVLYECLNLMYDYLNTNILQIIYYDLYDGIFDYNYEILYNNYIENLFLENLINKSKDYCTKLLYSICKLSRNIIFKFIIPKRSYINTTIRKNLLNNESYNKNIKFLKIKKNLNKLKTIVQPEQRSDEWYIFRNSTLTASNIWKIFVSEYSQTQLILEKCEPLNINKFKVTNTNSPLHWGQKYEPLSIMLYESKHNTKVEEFGCIPHEKYSYIAASPDGIICDENSDLYGRMLEIKNVVSREITGIPKMEYWIQMQIQMEVCNLDECDFLETKFLEYTDKEEYINDNNNNNKGIILQYLKDDNPYYIYCPLHINNITSNEYINWYNNQCIINKDYELINTLYWKLEKLSCVLVLRNKFWFYNILPYIENFWNLLLEEKNNGTYKERIKNKRKLQIEDEKSKSDFPKSGCLI